MERDSCINLRHTGGGPAPFPHPDSTKGLAVASGQGSWAELGCLAGRATRAKKMRKTRKEKETLQMGLLAKTRKKKWSTRELSKKRDDSGNERKGEEKR